VLRAMGVSEKDAQSSLRFTMGLHTTEDDVRTAAGILRSLVA
jgi:cysteine sulfinate desulfinase/cysteine desulfurase-like protein